MFIIMSPDERKTGLSHFLEKKLDTRKVAILNFHF